VSRAKRTNSIEKGRYHPNLRLAFKIARAFGKQIEDVFSYKESEEFEPLDSIS
jgi:DNA-binding XRE family transcriptional regulator